MSEPTILPPPDEIAARIRACREELIALRKLQRLAKAAEDARQARECRPWAPVRQEEATRVD